LDFPEHEKGVLLREQERPNGAREGASWLWWLELPPRGEGVAPHSF
jgi:hypothetical protein